MVNSKRLGAVGALLDEYEKSIAELSTVVKNVPDELLPIIIDTKTADENCKSIQAILSHVVNSGYGYACNINNVKEIKIERPAKLFYLTTTEYLKALMDMFLFTETVFKSITDIKIEELNNELKIKTSWGQLFDIEQLMEHAIVHILRHRRQLEKILLQVHK